MDSTSLLVWGMLFGGIGIGLFSYGRKQRKLVPLFTGISLLVFPYFMPSVTVLLIVGIFLVALPYFCENMTTTGCRIFLTFLWLPMQQGAIQNVLRPVY